MSRSPTAASPSPAIKLNVSNEVKPLLDKTVSEQIGSLANKLRNDRSLETAARKQWGQMCRSISLGKAVAGAPNLWLEVKPTRAFAAQPKILADWVILTLGVEAETRIVPSETKPDCPFPAAARSRRRGSTRARSRSACRSTCRSPN